MCIRDSTQVEPASPEEIGAGGRIEGFRRGGKDIILACRPGQDDRAADYLQMCIRDRIDREQSRPSRSALLYIEELKRVITEYGYEVIRTDD